MRKKYGTIFRADINHVKALNGEIECNVLFFAVDHAIAENSLKESEEKLRLFIEHAPAALAMFDREMRYLAVSRRWISDYNVQENDLIGKSHYEIFPEISDELKATHQRGMNGEIIAGDNSRFDRADGTVQWLSWKMLPWKMAGGRIGGIVIFSEDVTDRKQAEALLLESEKKYRDLANTVPVGIFEIDSSGTLTYVNKTLFDWFGYTEEEVKAGINIRDLADSSDRQRLMENIGQMTALESSPPREYCLVRKNGEKIQVLALTKPVVANGQVQGFCGTLLDLTEKKKMETVLQNASKLDSLGVLAGGIAHDFNNLLTGIFGNVDLARLYSHEQKTIGFLDATIEAMNRARSLTLQLLTFAKGGSPSLKITQLLPFFRDTVQFALSGSNVSCRFTLAEDLWLCNMDKNQIGRVIDNIVINAQQAMPNGGVVEVTATNISVAQNEHPPLSKGDYVKISIQDFGVGIPKDILPRIFDPFYTTKTKGHGLGLATSYSIIHRHGGCIDVESEPGYGSTFSIFLPAYARVALENTALGGIHKGYGAIIVMDDEDVVRETLRQMLELLGYAVVCATDGKAAIDYFVNSKRDKRDYAAIILDLTVPGGMGGLDAVLAIRKLDKKIPVFVASGYADNSVMNNPAQYGFTASISKPFTTIELSNILYTHMKK